MTGSISILLLFHLECFQKMTTVCLTILNKKGRVLFLFSFQSNLGVLYLLKYECSNDRKSVKKKKFYIPQFH